MAGCPATALMSCGGQDRISSAVRGKGLPGAPELASMVAPLVLGDTVCFAGRKGKLTVTTAEGKPLWSTKLPGQCHSAPAAADGLLIVGCDDGNLYAFRSA